MLRGLDVTGKVGDPAETRQVFYRIQVELVALVEEDVRRWTNQKDENGDTIYLPEREIGEKTTEIYRSEQDTPPKFVTL